MIVEYDSKIIAVKVNTEARVVKRFYYYAMQNYCNVLNHCIIKVFASIEFATIRNDRGENLENRYQITPRTRFLLGI
jgi:hypothetical protein